MGNVCPKGLDKKPWDLRGEVAAAGELHAEILRRLCHSVLDHQQGRLQDDATLLLLVWTGPR